MAWREEEGKRARVSCAVRPVRHGKKGNDRIRALGLMCRTCRISIERGSGALALNFWVKSLRSASDFASLTPTCSISSSTSSRTSLTRAERLSSREFPVLAA